MAWLEKREKGSRKVYFLGWWEGGKQKRRSLGAITAREARKIKTEFERLRVTEEMGIQEELQDVAFKRLCLEFREQQAMLGRSPNYLKQISTYATHWVKSLGGDTLVTDLRRVHIDRHIENRAKKVRRTTLNHEISFIKSLFRFGVSRGYLSISPADGIERLPDDTRSRTRPPVYGREHDLIEAADTKTQLFICFARYAGLREGEALQLLWEDIDFENGMLWIVHDPDNGRRTKSGHSRKAVLTQEIRSALQQWSHEAPESDWIFPAPGDVSTHQRSIKKALRNAYEKADIDPGGAPAHNLRHCFGTSLAESGCSAATIQVLMGHTDIRTSSRYLHPGFEAAVNDFRNRLFTYCSPDPENGHMERPAVKVVSALGEVG